MAEPVNFCSALEERLPFAQTVRLTLFPRHRFRHSNLTHANFFSLLLVRFVFSAPLSPPRPVQVSLVAEGPLILNRSTTVLKDIIITAVD